MQSKQSGVELSVLHFISNT